METIFALATARVKSGVAVLRVSGPRAFDIGRMLSKIEPEPGSVQYCAFRAGDGSALDRGLMLSFVGPHSFTGEDVVEFQIHGSLAIVEAFEKEILATQLARFAEAGEFTRRALENGRLDLAHVEGLAELIDAETEAQRQQAQGLIEGRLRTVANDLRQELIGALSLLESTIDFADEEVPQDQAEDIRARLLSVSEILRTEIAGSQVAERVTHGFVVAILGAPNVGKSTLLNRIAGRDIAITSEIAGTTRDIIELRTDLWGLPVTFLDTAGLRDATDTVEAIGVSRALDRARKADLRIFLRGPEMSDAAMEVGPDDLAVQSKSDLGAPGASRSVSGLTGDGVDALMSEVHRILQDRVKIVGGATNERHRLALEDGLSYVTSALERLPGAGDSEFLAEDIRGAVHALNALVGAVDVETVLGEIFGRFCIGK